MSQVCNVQEKIESKDDDVQSTDIMTTTNSDTLNGKIKSYLNCIFISSHLISYQYVVDELLTLF